jgi:hypothetical protein
MRHIPHWPCRGAICSVLERSIERTCGISSIVLCCSAICADASPFPSPKHPQLEVAAWANTVLNAVAKIGIDLNVAANFEPLLKAAGFGDWKVQKRIWPTGPWSDSQKEWTLGIWSGQDLEDTLGAVRLAVLTRI